MAGDKNHLTFVNLETDIFQGFETAGIGLETLLKRIMGFPENRDSDGRRHR